MVFYLFNVLWLICTFPHMYIEYLNHISFLYYIFSCVLSYCFAFPCLQSYNVLVLHDFSSVDKDREAKGSEIAITTKTSYNYKVAATASIKWS